MKLIFAFLAAVLLLPFSNAEAADSDTKISIRYSAKAITASNPPRTLQGTTEVKLTLRANGSVDDSWDTGGVGKGSQSGKLGPTQDGIKYRVLDASTIVRTAEAKTHLIRTTIRVSGKSCKAEMERELKPGNQTYKVWNEHQKREVDYRSIDTVWIRCAIK